MDKAVKKITVRAFLFYAIANILVYVPAHMAYLFADEPLGEIFELVRFYILMIFDFISPIVISSIALIIFLKYGKIITAISLGVITSARVFYSIPYYYLIFIYNYGYDSIEAIFLSLASSLFAIATLFLSCSVLLTFVFLIHKIRNKKHDDQNESICLYLYEDCHFDFLKKGNFPILIFSLVMFFVNIVSEVIDTVIFFAEYGMDYAPIEIGNIMINFILIFILLVISYITASKVKSYIVKKHFPII